MDRTTQLHLLVPPFSFPFVTATNYGNTVASTNEANTAEPWGTILELCDVVSREDKSDEAAKFMLRRLKTPNGRVQLQTIKLYLAAATNCGQ